VTPIAVWLLVLWLHALRFSARAALVTGLGYGLATLAWPYASTFLSEPLSAACLLAAALSIARYHTDGDRRLLWLAGACAGASLHVHILNVIAFPSLFGYAIAPAWRAGRIAATRSAWLGAVATGFAGIALLGLGHHLRFGSVLETGRYGHYSTFLWSWEGFVAQLVAPGRSFWLYSPVLVLGWAGWKTLRTHSGDAAWFALGIVATRWAFVSIRSDWWGGWGIGPRFLVAVIPFAILPLAALVEPWLTAGGRRGRALVAVLLASTLFQGWLAMHSIFEHMWDLWYRLGNPAYISYSHWNPAGSPIAGFWRFDSHPVALLFAGELRAAVETAKLDMLSFGAVRSALDGRPSMLLVFVAIAAVGIWAAWRLLAALRQP